MNHFVRLALLCSAIPAAFAAPAIHLLQRPAMNKSEIVFSYAGDLWTVNRQGGVASRLTSGSGVETEIAFSPDGGPSHLPASTTATPTSLLSHHRRRAKRITYHPDADHVVGWTPDGKRILFRSNRDAVSRYVQLYTVPPGRTTRGVAAAHGCGRILLARRQAHGLPAAR